MSNERLHRLPFDKDCKNKNILTPAKSFSMPENPYFSDHQGVLAAGRRIKDDITKIKHE